MSIFDIFKSRKKKTEPKSLQQSEDKRIEAGIHELARLNYEYSKLFDIYIFNPCLTGLGLYYIHDNTAKYIGVNTNKLAHKEYLKLKYEIK